MTLYNSKTKIRESKSKSKNEQKTDGPTDVVLLVTRKYKLSIKEKNPTQQIKKKQKTGEKRIQIQKSFVFKF